MDDFFSFFMSSAEDAPKAPEAPKTEPKKEAPKKAAKKPEAKKPAPKPVQTYKTPVTISCGYCPEFSLNADAFAGKESGITDEEILTAVRRLYPYFQKGATKIKRISETKCVLWLSAGVAQRKGTVKINKDTSCYLGTIKVPLTNFMKEDETEVEIKDLEKGLIPAIRCILCVNTQDNVISIIPGTEQISGSGQLPLPLTVNVLAQKRAEVVITADVLKEFAGVKVSDSEEADEEEIDEVQRDIAEATGKEIPALKAEPTADNIVRFLEDKFPSFAGNLVLCKCIGDDGKVLGYAVRFAAAEVNTAKYEKKEETYPTADLVISLLYKKYPVKPEDFGGKSEINVKDIAKYLRDQGQYEYTDDKTFVSLYDKDKKTVVVCFKAGTKG